MNKDVSKFFGAVLRTPWMGESVKLSMKVTRRDALLLSQLLDRGLNSEETRTFIPADALDGLKAIPVDLLAQADVPEEFSQSFRELIGSGKTA